MNNRHKVWMRFSIKLILIFVILGKLSAQNLLNQTIELKKSNYTLQEVIEELQNVHLLIISYGELPKKSSLNFQSRNQSIREILDEVFANTSHNYQVVGKKILIIRKTGKSDKSSKATVSGFIREAETGEALIGATIQDRTTGSGVIANTYGFFSLTLPKDSVDLSVSYLGFETQNFSFKLIGDITIEFDLESSASILEEVTVEATQLESVEVTPNMSTVSLTAKQIENVPMILGEHDVLKAIQLLPGVQGGTEGSSGIYVRGGGPDQNLFLLDGVPVYNTAHLFGFFSVFNGDAINNINVIKGGFPARYGGRLSSVIDISMKEGNNQKLSGKGAVGILSSKFTLEGPIKNENTSFIVSGRRTFLDLLARPLGFEEGNGFYFYDFNAKINHRFSSKDRVFLSFYGGSDAFSFLSKESRLFNDGNTTTTTNDSGINWGNIISVVRWNHVFNPKLFGNFSAYISRFRFNTDDQRSVASTDSLTTKTFEYASGIRDYAIKADFEYEVNPKYEIRFGGSIIAHQFKTGVFNIESTDDLDQNGGEDTHATEYAAYLENDFNIGNRLRINAGLHTALFDVNNTQYLSLQPRISGRLLLDNQLSFKASYAEMSQFIHLLTHSGIGLPTDLWVPATDLVKPQFSRQLAVGAAKILGPFEITLEGYYKEMENLIEYENGASYLSTNINWENKVEMGNGRSYGLEFLLRKNTGKFTGWLGYTLSKTTRQFDELNFGKEFLYKYDRRHDISAVGTYQLNDNWTFSGNWVFGTGNRISLAQTKYLANNFTRGTGLDPQLLYQLAFSIYEQEIQNFDQRNNYQLRSYHRLDLSVSHSKKRRKGVRTWTIGVYNAYSRLNPFYIFIDQEINPELRTGSTYITFVPRLKQRTLLPAIPFINYSFKF